MRPYSGEQKNYLRMEQNRMKQNWCQFIDNVFLLVHKLIFQVFNKLFSR